MATVFVSALTAGLSEKQDRARSERGRHHHLAGDVQNPHATLPIGPEIQRTTASMVIEEK
jgi:hypothetical protein